MHHSTWYALSSFPIIPALYPPSSLHPSSPSRLRTKSVTCCPGLPKPPTVSTSQHPGGRRRSLVFGSGPKQFRSLVLSATSSPRSCSRREALTGVLGFTPFKQPPIGFYYPANLEQAPLSAGQLHPHSTPLLVVCILWQRQAPYQAPGQLAITRPLSKRERCSYRQSLHRHQDQSWLIRDLLIFSLP